MEKQKFYTYKGYHLVRKNKEIYYGNMNGDYVARIEIQSTKSVKGLEIADKLKIQLLPTDTENIDITKLKKTNRENLAEALEVAHTWLEKANSKDVKIKTAKAAT
ncbi:MAG: hypothetical protein FWG83_00400 [Oscillospiraceae bacterium]|nr:hypothetical protein [Oscillospiraceae bacterium]